MTERSFISSHRNCSRFLTATHHAAILNNYSRDLQVLHSTLERGDDIYAVSIGYRKSYGRFGTYEQLGPKAYLFCSDSSAFQQNVVK